MNVYLLKAASDRYQGLCLKAEGDAEVLFQFDGTPIERWAPLAVEADEDDGAEPGSDFPSLIGHVPVFSRRAVEVLGEVLDQNGQLLPLEYEGGAYYAYNVTNLVDALDTEKSEIIRFTTGRILDIRHYELIPDKFEKDPVIFKLASTPLLRVFVTEKFTRLASENGLTGFDFKLIWGTR